MSQPNPKIFLTQLEGLEYIYIDDELDYIYLSSAKTKQTAYKRAAAKLRDLADKAERLANND